MTRGARVGGAGLTAVVALAGLLGAACGSGPSEAPPPAPPQDPQLVLGRTVYAEHCARCHGPAGGGGAGPRLAGESIDLEVVREGRRGMPAFESTLDSQELEAVAAYIAGVL